MTQDTNGVSMDEIKSHYDYGRRSEADIVRKILRDRRKAKYYPVFENIKKHYEESDGNYCLDITYLDNGLNIEVTFRVNENMYLSLLRIENYGSEYDYSVELYYDDLNEDYNDYPYALKEKTTDVEEMIADIKNYYSWP